MPPGAIPTPQPIADSFAGTLVTAAGHSALAAAPVVEADTCQTDTYIVRYGLRLAGKLHLSIVPGLVVLDYGDILTGEDAWDFLLHRSNLHPRAEVIGLRADGAEDMALLRTLDMGVPPAVLLYRTMSDKAALAQPSGLLGEAPTDIAPRLREYLPAYPTLADWLAAEHL